MSLSHENDYRSGRAVKRVERICAVAVFPVVVEAVAVGVARRIARTEPKAFNTILFFLVWLGADSAKPWMLAVAIVSLIGAVVAYVLSAVIGRNQGSNSDY